MDHKFYLKSIKEQKRIQIIIGLLALGFNLCVLGISIISGIYVLIFLSIVITLSVIAPFFDTPSLKKKGSLIYYSSLFIAEKEKNGIIIVHGGTLFDYVFVIDKKLNGKQRTNFVLQKYLEGLLNLVETYEKEGDTSVKIRGTTYILNERTASKIGFRKVKTDTIQQGILIFNYVNILIANSIAKGKITFPKLTHIKTFECELKELIKRKEFSKAMYCKLKKMLKKSSTLN